MTVKLQKIIFLFFENYFLFFLENYFYFFQELFFYIFSRIIFLENIKDFYKYYIIYYYKCK